MPTSSSPSFPKGYDTRVGERGVLLSAGQRQRIGLARALVREGGILVLDEATNAIDSMTEAEVMQSLESLHGRTVVVIAHRLSTTRMADQTIVLAHGRVIESGTPVRTLLTGRAVRENGQVAGTDPYRGGNRLQLTRPVARSRSCPRLDDRAI